MSAENLNVWAGTGNLTKDAEIRQVGEQEVCTFSIAVNGRRGKGDKQEVMYLNCDMWRPGGVVEYLVRGKTVAITGPLKCRRYEKDGQKRESWTVEVKTLQLIGDRRGEF